MDGHLTYEEMLKLQVALAELDNERVEVSGQWLAPSQCYRVSENLPYILFNTNCPDELKKRIEKILSDYSSRNESSAQENR
jgi:hypothetical protein